VPKNWRLPIRDILVYGGAKFLCPMAGSISMMPGTGIRPWIPPHRCRYDERKGLRSVLKQYISVMPPSPDGGITSNVLII
jgi:hypothetical protein